VNRPLDGWRDAPRRAELGSRRVEDPWDRSFLVAAWTELWRRTAGGSFERLPDPARHPECWFRFF